MTEQNERDQTTEVAVEGKWDWLTPELRVKIYAVIAAITGILIAAGLITQEQNELILKTFDAIWQAVTMVVLLMAAIHVKGKEAK